MNKPSDIMRYFGYDHLKEPMRTVSQGFSELANAIDMLPGGAEKSVALRKLLEAKDAAVRSVVFEAPEPGFL